mmetsp:Transcript_154125/g.295734  ORF Transcript_154125/g.295734 Transcript_154125/m.295734 type:complete len:468 (+) Transcript_154125:29-1432(+)
MDEQEMEAPIEDPAAAPSSKTDTEIAASSVFICDLAPGLTEEELSGLFGNYGEILHLRPVHDFSEEAAFVEFEQAESAREANSMLNHACLRGKVCRCLPVSALEVIWQTMDTGQRLVVENLDSSIESRGLNDVCGLFGQILDCKVELDEEERSRGYGFVHFSSKDEASKAVTFMDGMQIGEMVVEVRAFEAKDAALFTGCLYAGVASSSSSAAPATSTEAAGNAAEAKEADVEEAAAGDEPADEEKEEVPAEQMQADGPEQRQRMTVPAEQRQADGPERKQRMMLENFQSLSVHHLEVIQDLKMKLERLKQLVELYSPNQEQQMVVIASTAHIPDIASLLDEICEPGDYEAVSINTSKNERKEVIDAYATGNTFILVMAGDVATRRDFELEKSPSVLVNFDFPNTLQAYLYRIYKRADNSTRVHSFFASEPDQHIAVPLMTVMEEAGHEIPPALLELWTEMDSRTDA